MSDVPRNPAADEVPGERLRDRWEVRGVLGEGALGRTLRAWDSQRNTMVAIKELLPSRLKSWKDLELFEREATLLRRLNHPGVVAYRDHFELGTEGNPRLFLVQELLSGGTLEDELRDRGAFREAEVRALADEILATLIYLHERAEPILHRDIKPSNLMRRDTGEVVLIDFGAVHEVLDAAASGGGTMVGTFGYMPPEQYAGEAFPETDLFGLGATLVHLLTGRAPETLFRQLFEIRIPPEINLSPGFEQWLLRMIDPDRGRRFASARVARDVLASGLLMDALARPEALALLPPDPGPAPRHDVGFLLRDASTGLSHALASALHGSLAAAAATSSIAAFANGAAAIGAVALFPVAYVAFTGVRAFAAWARARRLYRDGEWTLGEVTGVYRPHGEQAKAGERRLTWRYLVGTRIVTGSIVTRAPSLAGLRNGDPIGLVYDPRDPEECIVLWM